MEAPLKKKKFEPIAQNIDHRIDEDDDVVRILLDDSSFESTMLKKKIGGNLIRTLHATSTISEFTHSPTITTDYQVQCVRKCQKFLLIGYRNNYIDIYNVETLTFVGQLQVDFSIFEVDNAGEYLYVVISNGTFLNKQRLCDFSTVWFIQETTYCFIMVEIKNEIYISTQNGISVLDMNNGLVKKTFTHELDQYFCSGITYDVKEEMIYCSFEFINDGYVDNVDIPTNQYKILIFEERTGEKTVIDSDHQVTFISLFGKYYIVNRQYRPAQLFEKKTNELLTEFNISSGIYIDKLYFDTLNSTFWYRSQNKVYINKLMIEENIIETPLNKEICIAFKKLGGKLPSFIPKLQTCNERLIPESLQYLLNINFQRVKLWFIDGEIVKTIDFFLYEYSLTNWMEETDIFILGHSPDSLEMEENEFAACLFIKQSEVSNLTSGDFPIYLGYKNKSTDYNYIIKSWKLSEFVTKLSSAERVKLVELNIEYSIHFEKIYEELLSQQIIDPTTREIDHAIIHEKYQQTIWGGRDYIFDLVKHFRSSTITFDGVEYKKIDLVLLADCCPYYCVTTLKENFNH